MAIRDTEPSEILEAVMAFYAEQLRLPEGAIFPTVEPMRPPVAPPGGDFWIHVGLGDGQFPLEEQDDEQLRETLDLTVVAFTRVQLDGANRDRQFLLNPKFGASALKRKLLLLVGEQLTIDDEPILASRVYARRSLRASYDEREAVGWAGIEFGLEFDWDLAGAGAEDLGDDN